jgi:hypothetical protein
MPIAETSVEKRIPRNLDGSTLVTRIRSKSASRTNPRNATSGEILRGAPPCAGD